MYTRDVIDFDKLPGFMRDALDWPPSGQAISASTRVFDALWPDPAAVNARNAGISGGLAGGILTKLLPSAAHATPQQSPGWLAGAQQSAVPASPAWPQPPQTQASRPPSPTMEQPSRSFLDAVAAHGEPQFVWSGLHPTPPSGHRAPDQLDLSDPFAVAAYRQRNAVRPMFGRGDPQRAEDALRAGLVSAADPFGIPSWLIGQVSPVTKDLIRAQYEDQPIASMIGSFATPTPALVVRGMEALAKAAPWTTASVLGLGGLALSSDEAEAARRLPMTEAARMRRAHAAGFWRNIPLEAGRAPLDEKIASAAIDVEGRIITGRNHLDAIERAERELRMPFENMRRGPIDEGFVTNAGRYVSRREATEIASRTGQGEAKGPFGMKRGLAAENTEMATAPAASETRTAATAPGLPGGEGIWSWVLPESGASSAGARVSRQRPAVGAEIREETAPTWHRAREPAQFDARGRSDTDIQETLNKAWAEGHDAVKLRNYTSPAGRTGDVIVVRDRAQLRDPEAAFDLRKLNSPNVMAGVAGAGFMAPYFAGVPFPNFPAQQPRRP